MDPLVIVLLGVGLVAFVIFKVYMVRRFMNSQKQNAPMLLNSLTRST